MLQSWCIKTMLSNEALISKEKFTLLTSIKFSMFDI